MGGTNTSEFKLHEPTIDVDTTNHYVYSSLEQSGNLLELTVTEVGTTVPVKVGQFIKLGNNPSRLYKIVQKESELTWLLAPGLMPWGVAGNPAKAETLRFEMLNEPAQFRDYTYRGPWSIEFQEANY